MNSEIGNLYCTLQTLSNIAHMSDLHGMLQVVERRGGVVHKPEDLVSPLHPTPEQEKLQHLDLAHTRLGKPARDETHPLWKVR